MTYPTSEQMLSALDDTTKQLTETAAYDDARRGEDLGLSKTVNDAILVLHNSKASDP